MASFDIGSDPPSPVSPSSSRSQSPFEGKKFTPLIKKIMSRIESKDNFFSFEFFPPRTANGALNLLSRMERMGQGNPLFCDITWHVSGNPTSNEPTSSITFAMAMINHIGLDTMLHITCCNQTLSDIDRCLQRARKVGISNLLLLRGDPPAGEEWNPANNHFNYASEFVSYVREYERKKCEEFTIAVAGYPMGHPDSRSYEEDLQHLKTKVDAGADFIITQLFFDSQSFIKFVKDCREIGIQCPILPGILPIQGYESLKHITKIGKIEVPKYVLDMVESIKDDDEAIRNYGIDLATQLCREILDSELTNGLHFYTLNREVASIEILKRLGLWLPEPVKPLPWKRSASCHRFQEEVRPIFWALRPISYIARTSEWEEFPNGRWGNSNAATFGDVKDHYIFSLAGKQSVEDRQAMWGRQLHGEEDVFRVFKCYISGGKNENGVKVTQLPWSEENLASETSLIATNLQELNAKGVLTINSQPNVNGKPSDDPDFGWGKVGGYVYQKAYLEFFVSADKAKVLKTILARYPRVNYHIINMQGEEETNCDSQEPIAVTWGVFPGKEIIQPTVVDPIAFKFWKDEAFSLWQTHWGSIYPEGSNSRKVIDHILKTYALVNLVDNNYPEENILWKICNEMIEMSKRKKPARSHADGIDYEQWPQKVGRKYEDREDATGLKKLQQQLQDNVTLVSE